jgi:hypothetical protein
LGAESKSELSFTSPTISPKSALSIISGMCTLGNEFNEEVCSNKRLTGAIVYIFILK